MRMANADSMDEEPHSCPEAAPAAAAKSEGEGSLSTFAEALREEIMVDVEAVLSQKADSLWKRGQAELQKVQQNRKEVASSLAGLRERQELQIAEQVAMQGALLDLTTKMEFVAQEMREALRTVGTLGKPVVESTTGGMLPEVLPSQATLPMPLILPHCQTSPAHLMASLSALGSLGMALDMESVDPGLVCTPPRIASFAAASPLGSAIAPPLPGSPAVLLSLASALTAAPAPSPLAGTTRLHIADCLDLGGSNPATPCVSNGQGGGGCGSPVSTSSSPGLNGSSSSAGSPLRLGALDANSPTSAALDASKVSFSFERRLECVPEARQALGGTLRADAPAFVPGGGFS